MFAVHQAPRRSELMGRVCVIASGNVDGKFGQATFEDGGGDTGGHEGPFLDGQAGKQPLAQAGRYGPAVRLSSVHHLHGALPVVVGIRRLHLHDVNAAGGPASGKPRNSGSRQSG